MELMNDPISKITGHLGAIVRAVDLCLGEKLILPTLMLIYSGIDVLAALEKRQSEGTRKSFVRWADRYLTPKMTCSGIDLYGARCGIVHSLSASSDLSRDQKARLVLYAWGTSKAEDLETIADALEWENQVVIHISDLRDSFAEAIGEYFEDVANDEDRVATVTKNAGKEWLSHVPGEVVDKIVGRASDGPQPNPLSGQQPARPRFSSAEQRSLDSRAEMNLRHLNQEWESWAPTADKAYQDWQSLFPKWPDVLTAVREALESDTWRESTDTILTFLARDHEDEQILDLLASTPNSGEELALLAATHGFREARWQAAVALGRIATPRALAALPDALSDPEEYVRRRALLALREHDAKLSEETAVKWLNSEHEYSRMVALDTLANLHSTKFPAALEKLRNDSSEVVRARLKKLENAE